MKFYTQSTTTELSRARRHWNLSGARFVCVELDRFSKKFLIFSLIRLMVSGDRRRVVVMVMRRVWFSHMICV